MLDKIPVASMEDPEAEARGSVYGLKIVDSIRKIRIKRKKLYTMPLSLVSLLSIFSHYVRSFSGILKFCGLSGRVQEFGIAHGLRDKAISPL
jgi:hypothetical protein